MQPMLELDAMRGQVCVIIIPLQLLFIITTFKIATMGISDYQGVVTLWKVVWRCAMMECGEQYAMTSGVEQKLQ